MKTFFNELLSYNLNANEKFFDILFANENKLSEKAIKLANHIVNAHHIWNNRIDKKEIPYHVWEIHRFMDLERLDKTNHEQSTEILNNCDLYAVINYKNTKGITYTNTILDILFHIFNHSNYHRAQIATELKQIDVQPPVTDYIFYKR